MEKKTSQQSDWIRVHLINLGKEIEEWNDTALELKIRRIVREVFLEEENRKSETKR